MGRPMVASHFKKTGKHLSLLSLLSKRPARFSECTTGFVTNLCVPLLLRADGGRKIMVSIAGPVVAG
jgi:hypothetical protein